jgi:hypothetical protein
MLPALNNPHFSVRRDQCRPSSIRSPLDSGRTRRDAAHLQNEAKLSRYATSNLRFQIHPVFPAQNEPLLPFRGLISPVLLCLLSLTPAFSQPAAPGSHSATLTFPAREILDAEVLRNPHYTIDDSVPVRDDRYVFTLRTSDGPITAHGMPMLQVRLDEVEAIRKAKKLDEAPQELEGVKDSIEQTGRGLKSLFKDPGETLSNIPKGLGRKVKSIAKGDKGGGRTRREFAAAVRGHERGRPHAAALQDQRENRR